jgi:polar amino acid transport system substrate-binding protein
VSALGWGAFQQDGVWRGIVPDLLQLLERRSGCTLQLLERPRARVMLDFQNGELDIVTSAQRTGDRDAVGDYLSYAYSGFDLVLHPKEAPVNSVAALLARPALRVGLVRGIQLSPRLMRAIDSLLERQRIEWARDFANLSARLQAERFGAAIFPTVIHGKLRHEGTLSAQFRVQPLRDDPPQPIGLYLQRNTLSPNQRQRLTEALQELLREDRIESIYARYLGAEATRRLFAAGRAAASQAD